MRLRRKLAMGTERPGMASWVVLLAQMPGISPKPAGILLVDPENDRLHIALADAVSTEEDIKGNWDSLHHDLAERASELGGARLLESLEQNLSLFLQIDGSRRYIATADPQHTIQALFQEHVRKHVDDSHSA
jgi:hypothetical protein